MTIALGPHLTLNLQNMSCFSVFMGLLQQGFWVERTTGSTIRHLLEQYGARDNLKILDRVQTLFLNGRPVDDMETAVLRDGDCLALSAAMPGLVGATLRAGGPLAGLRQSITFRPQPGNQGQGKGLVQVKLFNLLIKDLGPGFLSGTIGITPDNMRQLIRDLLASCPQEEVRAALDSAPISLDRLVAMDSVADDLVRLTAHFAQSGKQ